MGLRMSQKGDYGGAKKALSEALKLCKMGGDKKSEARVLNNIGVVLRRRGEPEKALKSLVKALNGQRQNEDRLAVIETLCNIGTVSNAVGEAAEAKSYFDEAVSALREPKDKSLDTSKGTAARIIDSLACHRIRSNEPLEDLIQLTEEMGIESEMVALKGWIIIREGHQLASKGRWDKAAEMIESGERAIDEYSSDGDSPLIYESLKEENGRVV
jgi:tetratricopeptide (TPR) repeat protein